MKKITAICLLVLLLFNFVGFEVYTAIMQDRADKTIIAEIDQNNYSDADLISIKVPAVHLSSYVNSTEFQRVDGQVELNGIHYNYVKRRYSGDSLELLCIPNGTANRIQSAKNDFFKLVNDIQNPGQSKKADQHSAAFKAFSVEYYNDTDAFAIKSLTEARIKGNDHYLLQIPAVYLTPAGQPPDLA